MPRLYPPHVPENRHRSLCWRRQREPSEITARLGSAWFATRGVEDLCTEVVGASVDVERLRDLGRWTVATRGRGPKHRPSALCQQGAVN
jgi:hypothetical protein